MTRHALTHLLAAATPGLCLGSAAQAQAAALGTQPETYGVATLVPNGPHRFFTSGFIGHNCDLINGDTSELDRSIPRDYVAGLAIAPDHSQCCVSETYWTHGSCVKRETSHPRPTADALKKQVVSKTTEIPGAAPRCPWGNSGFSSLRGDGCLPKVTVSPRPPRRPDE